MGMNEPAGIITQDAVRQLALCLDRVDYKERGEQVKSFAAQFGWSVQTVYRQLKKIGWTSGRKPRADKGTTSQCPEALEDLCATLKLGVRKNGKIVMQTPNALSMLKANGREFKVGASRINSLLKERGMDVKTQGQQRACQPLRSLHPNHVHLVDPSLCLIYYDPAGHQRVISDAEVYKNKPDAITKIEKFKVWRYVLVDHYSGTVIVKYYRSKGESQANMYDFLLYCWGRKDVNPFHGVPKVLYWDKGSANTAKAIQVALKALSVEAITHEAGNPRAKGSVEQANNLVEKLFESRLLYEPVNNVDELNVAAEGWMNAYNSNTIPHYDSRLQRKHMSQPRARFELWQIIRQDQLRLLPDVTLCKYLLSAEPVERKVRADLSVSFKHPATKQQQWYDVSGIADVYPNALVKVSPLVYGDAEIILYVENYKGEECTHIITPIVGDSFSGFNMNAAIIGEEMKSQPDTIVEIAGKAADRAAFPGMDADEIKKAKNKNAVPFEGTINAHSHLKNTNVPSYMNRPGSELDVPNNYNAEAKPLTHIEACKLLVAELGHALTPEQNKLIRQVYPDGVPETEFNNVLELVARPVSMKNVFSIVK